LASLKGVEFIDEEHRSIIAGRVSLICGQLLFEINPLDLLTKEVCFVEKE